MQNHSDKVNFIWSVADLIRDTFSRSSRWFQRGEKGDRKGGTLVVAFHGIAIVILAVVTGKIDERVGNYRQNG